MTGAVRRALSAAESGAQRPPSGGRLFDGALGSPWRAATALQTHARPRPVGPFLAAIPRLGDATFRCRVGGIVVATGPGVFVPGPAADRFVELALEWSEGQSEPGRGRGRDRVWCHGARGGGGPAGRGRPRGRPLARSRFPDLAESPRARALERAGSARLAAGADSGGADGEGARDPRQPAVPHPRPLCPDGRDPAGHGQG